MVRLLFIKMDLKNLQIEGISKSKYNLKNYEFSNRKIPSKKQKMSINHRWEFLSTSCEDFHNLYPESKIESLLDFLLNCSSKIPELWKSWEKSSRNWNTRPIKYSCSRLHWIFSPVNIFHLVLTEISVQNGVEIC